ncbi:hypothetical protein D3C76_1779930 [compost metagenome]
MEVDLRNGNHDLDDGYSHVIRCVCNHFLAGRKYPEALFDHFAASVFKQFEQLLLILELAYGIEFSLKSHAYPS